MPLRISDRMLALTGATAVVASVAAGLLVLYPPFQPSPESQRWRLDYHDSLARFADMGRLARCAWIVTGDVTVSFDSAVEALGKEMTDEVGCSWVTDFTEILDTSIAWERKGPASVELCGEIRTDPGSAAKVPTSRDFTFSEIGDVPVQAGHHCYTIDVSAAPPDYYGHPPSAR
jgi:hypothetical protein